MGYISERAAAIMEKLSSRYKLKSTGVSNPMIGDIITPISDMDRLLATSIASAGSAVDVSTTGWKVGFTVPAGKRYFLQVINCNGTTGTTARTTNFGVSTSATGISATNGVKFPDFTATNNGTYVLNQEIILEPGYTVQFWVSTANAGDYMTMAIWGRQEDVY